MQKELNCLIEDALKSLGIESKGFLVEHPMLSMGDYVK